MGSRGVGARLVAVALAAAAVVGGAATAGAAKKPPKSPLTVTLSGELAGTSSAATILTCGISNKLGTFPGQTASPWTLDATTTITGITYKLHVGIGKPPYKGKGTYPVTLDPAQPALVDLVGDPSQQKQETFPAGSRSLAAEWDTKNRNATGSIALTGLGAGSVTVTLVRSVTGSNETFGTGAAAPPPLPTVQLTASFRCKSPSKK